MGTGVATPSPTTDGAALTAPGGPAYYPELFIASFATLLLEISYTRVISFKLFYYYTYFVIGLALLGIAFGGVLVSISPRLRRAQTETVVGWSLVLGAASVGVSYAVVATASLDSFRIWEYGTRDSFANMGLLLVVCVALFGSFVSLGVIVSTLFGRRPEGVGRLYFADLLGAGLACALVVWLIGSIGPPATIFLAGLMLALAAGRIALRRRPLFGLLAGVLAAVFLVGAIVPAVRPSIELDATKADLGNSDPEESAWSPIFRVDVVPLGDEGKFLYHDGILGSGMYRWDGDVESLDTFGFDRDHLSFPFRTLGDAPRRELIIGAAGGHEVLASLYYEADQIDAVELNPVTHSLVTDTYAEFNGQLAANPHVDYINADGRSYLARSDDEYDLIWYPAPDSYSATNASTASAFVLSESYLYTSEAIEDSLEHLAPGGIIAAQFGEFDYDIKPTRTARYVATARHALAELGVRDPSRHILVANTGGNGNLSISTILVKKTPFTEAETERFVDAVSADEAPDGVQYAAGHASPPSPVREVASSNSAELERFYESFEYDVRPITDDGPFFWHFTPFDQVVRTFDESLTTSTNREVYLGERVLLLLLAMAFLLAAVFLLLPFVFVRDTWVQLPRKWLSAVYFSAIGLGFFLFEIVLIQRLILFLGYPTHSLTVTLMSLLIFLGIGALLTGRLTNEARALPWLLGAVTLLTAFYLFGLPLVTDGLLHLPLAARVIITFALLAPLGICLGMFMPLGVHAVSRMSPFPREYVAWGWAVNGFASVIGSVVTTILAMTFGFRSVLVVALVVYLVALAALRALMRTAASVNA